MSLRPFRVDVAQDRLTRLYERLRDVDWADEPDATDPWAYGVSASYLRELVEYWRHTYDWRQHEAAMNRWPHFRGDIAGVTVHVLLERGSGPDPLPLILTHGWPWTFWDYAKVIEPLAHPDRFGGDPRDSFDVVVPSLPGSVFSAPCPAGVGWQQTACLWTKLMDELGYDRFGAHGGDSGAFVTAQLAHEFADRLIGAHLSYPALLGDITFGRDDFTAEEVQNFDRQRNPMLNMTHFLTHTWEPQTLGWALQDSPVGLMAWMLHRRATWSDCGGDVEARFTKDELITTCALYWLTKTVASSLRFYADSFRSPWQAAHNRRPTLAAPTGIAVFPGELSHVPRSVAGQHANLVHWTQMPRGGHFAPMEEPQLLVDDIRNFFRMLR
jgi:pimeloyl-ACP methyl ester carboxylesterase